MKYTSESNRFISLSFHITLVPYHIIRKYIFSLVHVNLLSRITYILWFYLWCKIIFYKLYYNIYLYGILSINSREM